MSEASADLGYGSSSSSSSSSSENEGSRPGGRRTPSPNRGPRTSLTEVCGLTFPVPRIKAMLKVHHYAGRISERGAIFLTAALEYLATEIIELSLNVARADNTSRIKPKHINKAIKNDPDLRVNFKRSTLMKAGFYSIPAVQGNQAAAGPVPEMPQPEAGPSRARSVASSKRGRQRG